jgi:hypothetical protein
VPSSTGSSLSSKHQRELQGLRNSLKSNQGLRLFLVLFTLFGVLLGGIYLYLTMQFGVGTLETSRQALVAEGFGWGTDFAHAQLAYSDWLHRRGTFKEAELFDHLSELLFKSATAVGANQRVESANLVGKMYLSLHFGLMRLIFVLIAGWKVWMVAIGLGLIFSHMAFLPYAGSDFLGQTGNNRLYYSGIRVGLENSDSSSGAPRLQVTGLACPPKTPANTVQKSSIGRLLERNEAVNATNLALAGVIDANSAWPAYLANQDEEKLLSEFIDTPDLYELTEVLLQDAFELYWSYRDGVEPDRLFLPETSGTQTLQEHRAHLAYALNRVLTAEMKEDMAELSPCELATVLLALQAGKTLAYSQDGGRWHKKSQFPQLSARAVMHSVSEFGKEYDFDQRTRLRRALVYGARSSELGPIRMPVDLDRQSRALRQWVEVLMACPHELCAVADETELFGLVYDCHNGWISELFGAIVTLNPEVTTKSFATDSNLLFIPVRSIIELAKKVIPEANLIRLSELVSLVSQRQKLETLSLEFLQESGGEPQKLPPYKKVLSPIPFKEIKELAKEHELSEQEIKDWSSIRVLLNSFGWLARRVGDHGVPGHYLIHSVLKKANAESEQASMIMLSGMAALRATRLKEKWGPSWVSRFAKVSKSRIAASRSEAKSLMEGKEISEQGEEIENGPLFA